MLISLTPASDFWDIFLCVGSPFFGTFWAACGIATSEISPDPTDFWPATLFWALAYGGFGAILFTATLATFDRCLGRVALTSRRKISVVARREAGKPLLRP